MTLDEMRKRVVMYSPLLMECICTAAEGLHAKDQIRRRGNLSLGDANRVKTELAASYVTIG